MAILSAAAAKEQSDNFSEVRVRESFNNGVSIATSYGLVETIFEKKYYELDLIMSEITDAGYTVTDQGTSWLVNWE